MPEIKGYRNLSKTEVDLINLVKDMGPPIQAVLDGVRAYREVEIDHRWVAISETHFQQGMMALVRAIAKPEGF